MSTESNLSAVLTEANALGRPLCVDLDGTLITGDTLWENVLLLLRVRPFAALALPLWLFGGRARFKQRVADRIPLNPTVLPYRSSLIDALRVCRERGRKVVLATAANHAVAEGVARHLGIFDEVFSSDGSANLKASNKRDRLQSAFANGFDYIGDSSADITVFQASTRGFLVGGSSSTARAAERLGNVMVVSRRPSVLRALFKELRVHQWAKNALVFLPVLLAPAALAPAVLGRAALAGLAFSFCASAGYVFNDLLDIEADRAHPTKRARPLASGALPVLLGPPLFVGLLLAGFGLSVALLPFGFSAMLAIYFVGTLSYSLYLKKLLLLDVLVLAGLYTHRILAGGIATGIRVSAWLLGFSMFFFTSLAFAKRYVELRALDNDDRVKNRGYFRSDLTMVTSMGTASGYIAALVFMLYVESSAVREMYQEPSLLWLVLPILLYWLGRIWLLAGRGQMQEDPVKFALKDRQSFLCGALIAGAAALARSTPPWLAAVFH